MSIMPAPAQAAAIAISFTFPLLLFCFALVPSLRSAGRRFRIAGVTAAAVLAIACLVLPGTRQFDDVFAGILLLLTAILFWYVIWSLLAWGFTLTLLTSLAEAETPLTQEQWISAYMQGGNLTTFAQNRLSVLLGSGTAALDDGLIVATARGVAAAQLARLIRLALGIG